MNNDMNNKRDAFYAIIEFNDGFTSAKHEIRRLCIFILPQNKLKFHKDLNLIQFYFAVV